MDIYAKSGMITKDVMKEGKDGLPQRAGGEKMDTTVYAGRPEDMTGRLEKETAVYDLLDELGMDYTRMEHEAIATVEGCGEIEKHLGIGISKNLFLCNAQRTRFYLLVMPGKKRFVTKDFCRQIESPRLSFAPEEYMEEFLHITPGSVSIMGLMNDKENRVQLAMDKEILEQEYFGCHPCVNTVSMRISMKELLEKFLPAVHHDYIQVTLA